MPRLVKPSPFRPASRPAALASRPLNRLQCALIKKHYGLIGSIVAQLRHSLPACADLEELHSAGLTGLIAAVRRANSAQAKTFAGYAALRIRGAILDELRRLDWMPRAARRQARQLRSTVADLEQRLGHAPTHYEIRTELNLSVFQFDRLQFRTQPIHFIPLDQPLPSADSSRPRSLHDTIADDLSPPTASRLEHAESLASLGENLKNLPDRHREVIIQYYYSGLRLADIAARFGVTEARVCQLHGQALQLLRSRWSDRN